MVTTGINIPKDLLAFLRRVAAARANRLGGRASISAVLVMLVERHRAELERDIKQDVGD